MDERLMGEEVALELPCTAEAPALVLRFVEELLEVVGSEPYDARGLEAALEAAVGELCDATAEGPPRLQARLRITANGVDVRLARPQAGDRERRLEVDGV